MSIKDKIKLSEKGRKSIYVNNWVWDTLQKNINMNLSQWVEQQALKVITNPDDLQKINLKIKMLDHDIKTLQLEKEELLNRKEEIVNKRRENKDNLEIINEAMKTIRKVVENEGAIERSRIKFIANKYVLDSTVLVGQVNSEELKIIDDY